MQKFTVIGVVKATQQPITIETLAATQDEANAIVARQCPNVLVGADKSTVDAAEEK